MGVMMPVAAPRLTHAKLQISHYSALHLRPTAGHFTGSTAQLSFRATTSHSRRTGLTTVCAAKPHKVSLLGAAGGIGQPLALLLKMQPYVSELALYDIANTVGVAADLSHCNTPVKVSMISKLVTAKQTML